MKNQNKLGDKQWFSISLPDTLFDDKLVYWEYLILAVGF